MGETTKDGHPQEPAAQEAAIHEAAPQDSAKLTVRILLDVMAAHGVSDVVCSPGSRNAPLLAGVAARRALKAYVVIDERAAAFVALGIAQVSRRPVALVCTSGTAMLNYAPAVAEAYYQGLPLIVVTADRPREWIDQDDSQTIRQPGALANIVKGSYDISDRTEGSPVGWYEMRTVNDAMLTAMKDRMGPVHINVRISPPLQEVMPYAPLQVRTIRRIASDSLPDKATMSMLAGRAVGKRVLFIAAMSLPDAALQKGVTRLRAHSNVAVMAETVSNLHLPAEDYAVDSAIVLLSPEERAALAPDLIISAGGAPVAGLLKEWLRECAARNPRMEHWAVGPAPNTADCFQALTLRIEADPGRFVSALSAAMARMARKGTEGCDADGYSCAWDAIKREGQARVEGIAAAAGWCDLTAYDAIFKAIPSGWNLQVSNGTSIRYAQLLPRRIPHAEYCNRGVSGIDGSTTTAVGAALAYPGETLLVTGDMSLAYDAGALQTAGRLHVPLKIIVVNNSGGNIFRFINATSRFDCREEMLCADPGMDFRGMAAACGCRYLRADSSESLHDSLRRLRLMPGPVLLEVVTPPEESAAELKRILSRRQAAAGRNYKSNTGN